MYRRALRAARILLFAGGVLASRTGLAGEIEFTQDVLPILASKCFACHGPDPEKRKGGFRLDDGTSMYAPFDSGEYAVVPGDSNASLVVQRITSADPDMVMPPPAFPKTLSSEEIEIVRQWIAEGAPWEGHWAFQPLRDVTPPAVGDEGWSRNAIDRFIRQDQEKRGLSPSPEADRRTFIRRLNYDLLGLPPSPEDVAEFVADDSPDAYERLVDRLLDSPRYGERWARHWLDVVHYADTHGYDKDKRRPNAWPYRDYVIDSFNADKPYGRFIEEQLAGDVLYPDEPEATIATGFIAAGPWDFVGHVELREGTVDKAITRNLDRDDMVTSAMNTFASLTVQCARCHDHKFDPISQTDYYSLQAVFAGVDRADRTYDGDRETFRARRTLRDEQRIVQDKLAALQKKMETTPSPVREELDERLTTMRDTLAAQDSPDSPSNGYHSAIEHDRDSVKWVQVDLGKPQKLNRLRLISARPTDFPDTPGFGFPVRFKIECGNDASFSESTTLVDYTAADSPARTDAPLELSFDTQEARYLRVTATRLWERVNDYVFALAEMEVYADGANVARHGSVTALDSIEAGRWSAPYLVDGFDSRRRLDGAVAGDVEKLRAGLREVEQERKAVLRGLLTASERESLDELEGRAATIESALHALPASLLVYAAASDYRGDGNFNPPRAPRVVHVLKRGEIKQPGAIAAPGTVGCIPSLPSRFELPTDGDEGPRRAMLAHWLTNVENPLPWRSLVNRVWQYHFGRGIVDTPNDFGRMGAPPTHPELLDWLALRFLEHGQSLKWLHREIVTSATYRQQSLNNDVYASIDGDNRYLWRMNRRQIEAEALYDSVLVISGKMDFTMGGPGFDSFAFEDDHSPRYLYSKHDPSDPAAFRRAVYRFIVRSVPDPFMTCLDAADPSQSVPVRSQTLTALQALATLNNPMMVQQAAYFAERVKGLSDTVPGQIAAAYRLALLRDPTAEERELLTAYADAHGMAALCRLLFNTNEFVYVD